MERLDLSKGELMNMLQRAGQVLERVPVGAQVSLEGPPIFLNQSWDASHELGYNHLLPIVWGLLDKRGCTIEHTVLFDEYSVQPIVVEGDYLERMSVPVHLTVRETTFLPRAEELMRMIAGRGVTRLDGYTVALVTQTGRMRGVFLDAAFQETKVGSVNIQVLPYQLKPEQEEMRAILLATRGKLPSTFINIFFKGRGVKKAYVTDTAGNTICYLGGTPGRGEETSIIFHV